MKRVISVGNQSFEAIRSDNRFYIDKTRFIKDWWDMGDIVTLITRPRRFGKTLNMDMLKCFFSNKYHGRNDLFDGLDIWNDEKYRKLQGTYPVIFLSFAGIKGNTFEMARQQICIKILDLYEENGYLLEGDILSESEKTFYKSVSMNMSDAIISTSLNKLCTFMYKYYGKKVIILLDEYDTPMQEAYVNGYWNELTALTRSLFNFAFKTNPYLERGIMTGITRVSKESIFSDLNNLVVVTTTSNQYTTAFGFTEEEVFTALDEQGMSDEKEKVKAWYDGFTFGDKKDIYNPWSITNFLDEKKYKLYWADSSSNALVNKLIRTAPGEIKEQMERLISGESIETYIDEQIVFDQLDMDENAVWSLLLASGYLKVEFVKSEDNAGETLDFPIYSLRITNREVRSMFVKMFKGWFNRSLSAYNNFIKALLVGDIESMNEYMNDVALNTFSLFDAGKKVSEKSVDLSGQASKRTLKKGYGTFPTRKGLDQTTEKLLYNEYLLKTFGYAFRQDSEQSEGTDESGEKEWQSDRSDALAYELEYILQGKGSDKENLESVLFRLFLLRISGNYGCLAKDMGRVAEALAVTISALLLMPEAVEALKQMILVAWAGGESVMDLRCLLDGRKVPLVKSADKWVVSLSQLPLLLTDGGSVRGNDSGEGVGYSDYIRMFLFLKSVPEITMRTLDCVEEALHSKHILFQADQCVTKLEIQNKIIVYKNLNYQYPVYFGYE